MKVHVTERSVASNHNAVVCNHCPTMLALCATPYGYNAGVYGWNFDVRRIGNCDVLNGYRWVRNFKETPYEWDRKWEKRAVKVSQLPSSKYDAAVHNLVSEFAKALDDFVGNTHKPMKGEIQ